MFFGTFGFLGRCPRLHLNIAPLTLTERNSLGHSFRLRRECFQERRAGKGQSPEQVPERKRRIGFQSCLIVHAGGSRQFSLEMRDRARRRVVCIEITESPAHQCEQPDTEYGSEEPTAQQHPRHGEIDGALAPLRKGARHG